MSLISHCYAQPAAPQKSADKHAPKILDLPTRPGVTDRILVLAPSGSDKPKAAVILFAGGHGGLQIAPDGSFKWGAGNFLIRSREMFVDQGLLTVIVDAPSDRQTAPFLAGFRTTPQHVTDIKAVIAWVRKQYKLPVWLVGTSHGTQSAAFVATQFASSGSASPAETGGPDGLVLTSTILSDNKESPVPAMPLGKLRIPVLVVHHEQDGCSKCPYSDIPALMAKFTASPRKQLIALHGGQTRGDPCEAWSYHGFNGLEQQAVSQITNWILAK
ncbi:MAG TPA: hypothetical protein VGI75_04300 [Pirellulales bacterium]